MREAAAIVESVVDVNTLTREILKEHIALQDDERNADAHERKSVGFRESAARRRVEIGRMLIEVKRVTKHGGWLPYLEKIGISDQSARNWMALAGHVEGKSKTGGDVLDLKTPTLADAGRDSRPRKSDEQPDPPARANLAPAETATSTRSIGQNTAARTELAPAVTLDIDRELSRIQDKLCAAAATMPASVRKQVAHELRETARIIEEMS